MNCPLLCCLVQCIPVFAFPLFTFRFACFSMQIPYAHLGNRTMIECTRTMKAFIHNRVIKLTQPNHISSCSMFRYTDEAAPGMSRREVLSSTLVRKGQPGGTSRLSDTEQFKIRVPFLVSFISCSFGGKNKEME